MFNYLVTRRFLGNVIGSNSVYFVFETLIEEYAKINMRSRVFNTVSVTYMRFSHVEE